MNNDEKDVLAANEAFYNAFVSSDYTAMEALWAVNHDVAVIHPGWSPLHGYRAVMDSWQRILSSSGTPSVHCTTPKAYLMDTTAFVICTESFEEADLVATNIFVREHEEWRIVHHQSGPRPQDSQSTSAESVH